MANSLDVWIVLLNEIMSHAIKIRDENVMEYEDKEREAFDMGLNMLVLLMKKMMEEMLEDNKE
jgi:hypothetical protein|tara:strand:- start:932 stop:1120 length:189 start_codon:yes stop_codon:yes gene_type:complete